MTRNGLSKLTPEGSEGGTGNSRCKGPEASMVLMCLQDREEARVAGARVEGVRSEDEDGRQGRA